METRALGETGQESTVLTFGGVLLRELEQVGANRAVALALDHGVNHLDVAPTYGDAELKLGPKLREHREEVFLGCKTRERSYGAARAKLRQSLNRLGVETIDLYQFHAVSSRDDLDETTGPDGSLRAFREAKEVGLIDHIGPTSHEQASVIHEAIDRIDDLATLMFPLATPREMGMPSRLDNRGSRGRHRAIRARSCRSTETVRRRPFSRT